MCWILGLGQAVFWSLCWRKTKKSTGVGVDVSELACLQASANAVLHRVQERAEIKQSDWLEDVEGSFELIVSNPPYITRDEMNGLAAEVRPART